MALLEDLQEQWSKDCIFDELDLGSESLKVPSLHQKYHVYYNKYKLVIEDEKCKLKTLWKSKWMYYNGKGPDINGEYFDHKILKGDINTFLESDKDNNNVQKNDRLKVRFLNESDEPKTEYGLDPEFLDVSFLDMFKILDEHKRFIIYDSGITSDAPYYLFIKDDNEWQKENDNNKWYPRAQ